MIRGLKGQDSISLKCQRAALLYERRPLAACLLGPLGPGHHQREGADGGWACAGLCADDVCDSCENFYRHSCVLARRRRPPYRARGRGSVLDGPHLLAIRDMRTRGFERVSVIFSLSSSCASSSTCTACVHFSRVFLLPRRLRRYTFPKFHCRTTRRPIFLNVQRQAL